MSNQQLIEAKALLFAACKLEKAQIETELHELINSINIMKKFTLDKGTRTSVIVETKGDLDSIELTFYTKDEPRAKEIANDIVFAGNLNEQYNIKAFKSLFFACVNAHACNWDNKEDKRQALRLIKEALTKSEKK